MGARKGPTVVGTFQKAEGPAEVAASPSHGSTHRGMKDMNEETDTTAPAKGASFDVTRFQMASLREEIESTLEAIAGATLLFRSLALDKVTPSAINVELSAFNVKVMHTAIDRAWGAAADTLERMADIEEAVR